MEQPLEQRNSLAAACFGAQRLFRGNAARQIPLLHCIQAKHIQRMKRRDLPLSIGVPLSQPQLAAPDLLAVGDRQIDHT